LREVLVRVVERPELIEEKSPAALRRAHCAFSWDAKVERVLVVYRSVLGSRAKDDPPSRT